MEFTDGLKKFAKGSVEFMISSLSNRSKVKRMKTKKLIELKGYVKEYSRKNNDSSKKRKIKQALNTINKELEKRNRN